LTISGKKQFKKENLVDIRQNIELDLGELESRVGDAQRNIKKAESFI
jgi:hypothetical protein